MIIQQTSQEILSPIILLDQKRIVTSEGNITESSHRSAIYNKIATAEYHYEYTSFGNGNQISIVSQSIADSDTAIEWEPVDNALDISDWPLIRRNSGVNSFVSARISNGRSITDERVFDFRNINAINYNQPLVHAVVPGSVLDITANIVSNLADAMTSNAMWDTNSNRAQTSVIPHQYFTGHVWKAPGYMAPGTTPGITNNQGSGKRFMAITRRHLQACGHYAYAVGDILKFKDINNNIIDRQVIHVVNLFAVTTINVDLSIYLLNEDLPESITILPVMGAWGSGIVSETSETVTTCSQIAGIVLYNNDGHIGPFIGATLTDDTLPKCPSSYEGLNFDLSKFYFRMGGVPVITESIPKINSDLGDKFYHFGRGGDSGSPILVPCDGGWCYATHISKGFHPNAELFNELIAFIDAKAVASGAIPSATNYTVTVAQPPTA